MILIQFKLPCFIFAKLLLFDLLAENISRDISTQYTILVGTISFVLQFTIRTLAGFERNIALVIYVDDVIVTSDNMTEVAVIKQYLHDKFKIKDFGTQRYFLGLEVAKSSSGINLSQQKYALDLLIKTDFLISKPISSSMTPKSKLSKTSGTPLIGISSYRTLISKLLYLTHTRPDISFSIQQLSQFLDCPTDLHLKVAIILCHPTIVSST